MKILRKALLFGLGATMFTKEKVEEAVDTLIKRGELAQEERNKAIEELLQRAEEERKTLVDTVTQTVQSVVSQMGIATKKDVDELAARLAAVEAKLAEGQAEKKAE